MKTSLKVERAKNDFTQADLAERVGVSRQTINAIEKGRYNLSIVLALKLAYIFKVRVEDIFELEQQDWE
ncbi:helix-turn-helix transcriptional regulator [Mesonia mobilis]|uniref:Transcriptional regulator n=1 Tax=Mesonia mobilis TaxID=369791 RepID=A0ABQ3BZA5_9FLAO|nr:helix-turn-helix transcriptional regulator [Mesonia mobilis]GGZ61581.1 transcriptional regulator [Mesonia mobilis]